MAERTLVTSLEEKVMETIERTGHLVNNGTAVDSWHIVADFHIPEQ